MDREQAVKFLTEDCVFPTPLTVRCAEEIWEALAKRLWKICRKKRFAPRKLPLSAADMKAVRKFHNRHPDADSVVDFVRLNPMDLVVHRLWVSPQIANGYRDKVTPDRWLQTALLDPPANSQLKWRRESNTIVFDLPHSRILTGRPAAARRANAGFRGAERLHHRGISCRSSAAYERLSQDVRLRKPCSRCGRCPSRCSLRRIESTGGDGSYGGGCPRHDGWSKSRPAWRIFLTTACSSP